MQLLEPLQVNYFTYSKSMSLVTIDYRLSMDTKLFIQYENYCLENRKNETTKMHTSAMSKAILSSSSLSIDFSFSTIALGSVSLIFNFSNKTLSGLSTDVEGKPIL